MTQRAGYRMPSNTAQWLIVVLLAVIATTLLLRGPEMPSAQAQPAAVGARGIFAFTGQLDHNRFGLFMLDVDQGTIWCYEIDSSGAARKLRLIAARSWIYDRYLQDFNCAAPDFRAVQELVAQQRRQTARPDDSGDGVTPAAGPASRPTN